MIYVIGCLSIVGGPPPVRFLIRANRQPVSNFQSPADFLVFFFFFFFFIIIIIIFFFFFFFFFFLVFFFSFYGSPTRRNPFLFFLFTSPFFLMSFDSSVALIFFDLFLFLLVGKMESKIDCSVTGFWILGFFFVKLFNGFVLVTFFRERSIGGTGAPIISIFFKYSK